MDNTRSYAQGRDLEQAFLGLAKRLRSMLQEPHAKSGIADQEPVHCRRVHKADSSVIDHFRGGAMVLLRQQRPVSKSVALMRKADYCGLAIVIEFPDGDQTELNEIEPSASITLYKNITPGLICPANDIAIEQINLISAQLVPLVHGARTRTQARALSIAIRWFLVHHGLASFVNSVAFSYYDPQQA